MSARVKALHKPLNLNLLDEFVLQSGFKIQMGRGVAALRRHESLRIYKVTSVIVILSSLNMNERKKNNLEAWNSLASSQSIFR